ncbi:MAG: hypothetical protein H0U89_10670 [Acidimicrobiia bacterium]|nr:hypothetical protein [Acidimicrobiia bacterium]
MRAPARDLACLGACVALGVIALVQGDRVPLLSLVDLGFHELGHLVSYGLPVSDVVKAAAGSVGQVGVPLALAAYFLAARREQASAGVCLAWAATSLRSVATYVADAPFERLPLIGGEHDWAFILGPEGTDDLGRAASLAAELRAGAWVLLALALAGCAWSLVVSLRPVPAAAPGLAGPRAPALGARRTI